MSGVKNLRAMFEQKGETSPPENRGRSPGAASNGTESPRPLSRIRTSFVAVEKDGRIGVFRDASRESSISITAPKVPGAPETTTPSSSSLASRPNPAETMEKPSPKTTLKAHPIPESPHAEAPKKQTATSLSTRTATKGEAPPLDPDTTADVEKTSTRMVSGGLTGKAAATGKAANLPSGNFRGSLNGGAGGTSKGKAPAKEGSITALGGPTKAATRTVPAIPSPKTATKPEKSPTVAKAPRSPAATTPKHPAKTPDRPTATKTATSAAKASGSSSAKKPPSLQPSSSIDRGIGFVKPKPKSPTRPVNLPAGLTTHTASSGSKVSDGSRQSLSRASGNLQPPEAQGRSSSRTSISTAGTAPTTKPATTTNVKGQSSTATKPRASFGPPPKKATHAHAQPAKKEKAMDDDFLSRMMRHTESSSSKTADKPAHTGPRRVVVGAYAKKQEAEPTTQEPKQVKKAIAKPKPATAPEMSSSQAKKSAAKVVAPVVEQAATAEEVIHIAKKAEGTVPLEGKADLPEEHTPAVEKSSTAKAEPAEKSAPAGHITAEEQAVEDTHDTAPEAEVHHEPEPDPLHEVEPGPEHEHEPEPEPESELVTEAEPEPAQHIETGTPKSADAAPMKGEPVEFDTPLHDASSKHEEEGASHSTAKLAEEPHVAQIQADEEEAEAKKSDAVANGAVKTEAAAS